MFPRIVSRLSLSPSAMSDLVFYARRLKQESVTRTFSAIAAVLIVALQFATILAPPTPTNAASPSDIIYGGFVSKDDLLNRYDANAELQALYNYMGITRDDIARTTVATINSTDRSLNSLGRIQHEATDQPIVVDGKAGQYNQVTYWARYLYQFDTGANVTRGSNYQVLQGTRSRDGGYFAVIFRCGNLVFKTIPPQPTPPPPPKPSPTPTPPPTPTPTSKPKPTVTCTGLKGNILSGETPLTVTFTGSGTATGQTISEYLFDFGDGKTINQPGATVTHQYTTAGKHIATLKVKGSTGTVSAAVPACSFTVSTTTPPAAYTRTKSAHNLTQNLDATTKLARPNDEIRYTLTTKNVGSTLGQYVVVEHVEDILEYATITDLGGGKLKDGVVTWPETAIAPGNGIAKAFTIKIKDPIPATPVGLSDKFSYDLRLDNVYGDHVRVGLEAPLAKQVEGASTSLPDTGAGAATIVVLVVSTLSLFFYFRNRQLMTEIKLLRSGNVGGGGYL